MSSTAHRISGLLMALMLGAAIACGVDREDGAVAPQSGAAAAALQPSDAGLYLASVRPASGRAPLGAIHEWVLHLETVDGGLFVPSALRVDGGMPQHGHGFVTSPRYARPLGDGDFLIEGVKFHMPGEWTIRFEIAGPAGPDVATFVVEVDP